MARPSSAEWRCIWNLAVYPMVIVLSLATHALLTTALVILLVSLLCQEQPIMLCLSPSYQTDAYRIATNFKEHNFHDFCRWAWTAIIKRCNFFMLVYIYSRFPWSAKNVFRNVWNFTISGKCAPRKFGAVRYITILHNYMSVQQHLYIYSIGEKSVDVPLMYTY